ncbi:MAG: hypothetical protein CM1200mP2_51050 [Planctomycetaceae bacterium]|nr:MAG: hypothetical protein CM1200mP2_51050 [Planctomycetaceae bacterium]
MAERYESCRTLVFFLDQAQQLRVRFGHRRHAPGQQHRVAENPVPQGVGMHAVRGKRVVRLLLSLISEMLGDRGVQVDHHLDPVPFVS